MDRPDTADAADPLAALRSIARDPRSYVQRWREEHPDRKVLGVLPMNFPRELAHAAGVLPVIVPDDQQPVTEGRAFLPEFYCGFTRNLADQAATGRFDLYDGLFVADHCIQLLGATDIVRELEPRAPVFLGQLISSLSDRGAGAKIAEMVATLRAEVEAFAGTEVTDAALAASIRAFNRDRSLIRRLFDARAAGDCAFGPVELQDIVASAQVMDPDEHHALLSAVVAGRAPRTRDDRIRVHLSGHLCHAPRRELLEVIEEAGAVVVDDDLWTGRRYLQTDLDESLPPMTAVAEWYAGRNVALPCPTRVQHDVDWDQWLLAAAERSGAEAVVHLMPKFCEPHMLYYPELRRALEAAGIPQLLIETEHEGIPLESFRTRLEALIERSHRNRPAYA
ncbi:2-hydroxyacyl-CoA dehydratase subunit D [Nocardioides nitrophenolicus]|uniref:2-hydroxyacyl-CoA dehydratase subunit D n=1 Tax=Nocardioides nitrophenolicus TaxID=60489 RepID=UPI00195CF305|nr:2-hydroxyacyl-CoA dehydratase family protein [Nocardioides nitrophenolicus]MBM7517969.1 benzoyl-CoA reductase/2-hydroxyglutaryl-CoA dehydratase subunit BcrC/BadD/HgdB [Nocardioides nitrophenolicus]